LDIQQLLLFFDVGEMIQDDLSKPAGVGEGIELVQVVQEKLTKIQKTFHLFYVIPELNVLHNELGRQMGASSQTSQSRVAGPRGCHRRPRPKSLPFWRSWCLHRPQFEGWFQNRSARPKSVNKFIIL